MKKLKPKLIVIVGPTASGKSALAVRLAKRFVGEVVSADSRQVYRGLDLGTGKITTREMQGVPHHLLDVANPKRQFSVVGFKHLADQAIVDISARKRIPILVGGTGFWIDAVVYDRVFPEVPPNRVLRKKLENRNATDLLCLLAGIDLERARTIEQKNPRRIIRAIEIAKALGRVPRLKQSSPYDALWIGVRVPESKQRAQIRARMLKRMRAGMIKEALRLRTQGLTWRRFYELGLEYRFLADFLRKKYSRKEILDQLERATRDYARRQMVWFKKNPAIHWVANGSEAERLIKKFLAH